MKKQLKTIGLVALYVGIFFGIVNVIYALTFDVLYPIKIFSVLIGQNNLVWIILSDAVSIVIFSVLIFFIKKQSILKYCKLTPVKKKTVIVTASLGLAMGIFTIMMCELPFIKLNFPEFEELFKALFDMKWMAVFVVFLFIGTFFREVLFRGLIFNELSQAFHIIIAMLIHALLYGPLFFNLNPPLSIYGFLGAIIFACIFYKYNSLFAVLAAQFVCIGSECILRKVGYLYKNNYNIIIPLIIISGISVIVLFIHILRIKREQQVPATALKNNNA